MTPTQLRDLILSQPEGSPIRVAFPLGDAECEVAINAKTLDGFIPRRHLSAVLTSLELIGVVRHIVEHRQCLPLTDGETIPPFTTELYRTMCSLWQVLSVPQDELRTPIDDKFEGSIPFFAAYAGIPSAGIRAALIAGAGKISLIEKEFGLDKVATAQQIAEARNV